MNFDLQAVTEPGRALVRLAEEHASDFATRADVHDRENTYVADNIEAMRATNVLAACAPEEHGGLGVESVHDLMVAVSRLARGCASTAISANMHLGGVWTVTRWWRQAVRNGDEVTAQQMEGFLHVLGRSQVIISGAGTEPGAIGIVPFVEATPVDGGYVINGRKVFATNSEIADSISVMVRVPCDDGLFHGGMAIVLKGTEGMDVRRNWDALGMRGSGSHDIVFDGCFVPAPLVQVQGPVGVGPADGVIPIGAVNFPLIGAFLGIAEAARQIAVDSARTTVKKPFTTPMAERPGVQHRMAELEVALASARGVLDRAGRLFDGLLGRDDLSRDEADALMSEWQCAKLVVSEASAKVVERAMDIAGGASYLTGHPLARLYRDVRAGPFMQPLSPIEAYPHIGRVALGLDPVAEFRQPIADGARVPAAHA